jgi:hypothetical protein
MERMKRDRKNELAMLADFSALCVWATAWGLLASLAAGVFVLLIH